MKRLLSVVLLLFLGFSVCSHSPASYAGWKANAAAAACAIKKGCRQAVSTATEKVVKKCKAANCIEKSTSLAKKTANKAYSYFAKKKALKTEIPAKQLQAKFKHAGDFGVQGNYSQASALKFKDAITNHISSKSTEAVKATYRGSDAVIFIDKSTQLGVITNPGGEFISGWKFTADKVGHLFSKGSI